MEEYVKKAGVEVKRFDIWNDRIEDFEILHVFGSVKDCLALMEVARARKVKVVLESIFWSDFRRAFFEDGPISKKAELVVRHGMKLIFPFFPSSRRKMFQVSDSIFPNSENEAKQISRLFSVPMEKMFVVPNGVDSRFAKADPKAFVKKYGLKDFVLSVGRIEPRKNQLNLIRAMKGIARDLVLVGEPVSGYEWYYEKCVKEADKKVHFLGAMTHESDLLVSAYSACEVFALPGWFETPGLAALEAALAGAKVAATVGGSTREYFSDKVVYFRPDSPGDIKKSIEASMRKEKSGQLKDLVLNSFTWEKVAEKAVEGYKLVLER
jgi:glycosyltransferase involved in cell wall biosynthesis